MEGGRIQETEEEEEDSRRWRRDEGRGYCDSTGEGQQPQTRTTGPPKSSAATPNKRPTQASKIAMLPHTSRTSAVTNAEQGIKDVVCRCINNGQTEHPS